LLVLSWGALIQGIAPVLQCFLYVNHRFVVASFGKTLVNCSAAVLVMCLRHRVGILAAAIGFVVGSAVQLGVLGIAARAHGLKWTLPKRFEYRKVSEILRGFGYPVVGHAISESRLFVETFLASMLPAG